jgi:hypothetical protein
VHRADNMIIQAINILDQIDKDVNTFSMRVKCVFFLSRVCSILVFPVMNCVFSLPTMSSS